MDDELIQKFEELWNKVLEVVKELWEKLKEFAGKLFPADTNPKPKRKVRDNTRPNIIKCIGRSQSGYSTKIRTRTRNSC